MEDEALTFSDLRKIQKKEKRQEQLTELDDNFLLKVSQYLDRKKDVDDREYKNAKRVLDKIIGLRQEKIVKKAKISVKSNVKSSKLNLLPREKELFRDIKERFNTYSDSIEEVVKKKADDLQVPNTETEKEPVETEETAEQSNEESVEDGYEKVRIVSNVPEFMGTDLESYGPFEEGEKTELPEENADILVNRGSAEKVEN